jgi:hypothetical protein
MSDFPEFDAAYDAMLLPEDADRFNHIAAETRFNIYNSPIWRVQGRKFSHALIKECLSVIEDTNDRHRRDYFAAKIREHFGIEE